MFVREGLQVLMDEKEEAAKQKKNWMSEGILLAAIPVMVYLCCFCYKLAYLSAFDIPSYLVSVDTNALLLFGAAALPLLWMILAFGNRDYAFDHFEAKTSKLHPVHSVFVRYVFVLMLLGVICLIGRNWFYMWVLFPFIVIDILFAATNARKGDSALSQLRGILILHPSEKYLNRFDTPSGRYFLQLLCVLLLGMAFAYITGWREGKSQTVFYSLESDPNSLVVDITDGKALCVFYSPSNHKLIDRIKIVPCGEKDGIALVVQTIPVHN